MQGLGETKQRPKLESATSELDFPFSSRQDLDTELADSRLGLESRQELDANDLATRNVTSLDEVLSLLRATNEERDRRQNHAE